MGADAGFVRTVPPVRPVARLPLRSVMYGMGSVFGKTLRDARFAVLVVGGLLGVMVIAGGVVMADTYGTPEARRELDTMASTMPPEMRGFYGDPRNVGTLGGFISWHYGAYFALLGGLWSILSLSSTLATESRRGSMDFTLATPRSRRLVAIEKVAAHVAALGVAMGLTGALAWVAGLVFARFPGDEVTVGAAAAFTAGLLVRSVLAGAIAFALAPLVGRGPAAGVAGTVLVGGYVVYGYRSVVDGFDAVAGATWWSWTAGHVPLAGSEAWAGLAVTLIVALVLLAAGVELFVRRDVGVVLHVPGPTMPGALLGLRGPVGRSFGDTLPAAAWWSAGLAVYALLMAAAARALLDLLSGSTEIADRFRALIPDVDITRPAGFLQFAFVDLGLVLVGLAAVTFVAGRWSDESEGRVELQLAAPLSRRRWALGAGAGAALGVVTVTVTLMAAIGIGVTGTAGDAVTATAGVLALGLFGLAVVGVGMAAGGLLGAQAAVPVTLAFVVGTFLLDTLAPILRLPDWMAQLSLTTHLGEPLIGRWDPVGAAACVVLAIGGLAIGMGGVSRRDIAS